MGRKLTFQKLKTEKGWPYGRQHTSRLVKRGRSHHLKSLIPALSSTSGTKTHSTSFGLPAKSTPTTRLPKAKPQIREGLRFRFEQLTTCAFDRGVGSNPGAARARASLIRDLR